MPVLADPLRVHSNPGRSREWDYFHHCCIEQVFGGSEFDWIKLLVAQLGKQEEAVNAAVVAFSATHETSILQNPSGEDGMYLYSSHNDISLSKPPSKAAIAYGAAVGLLSKAIGRHGRVAVPAALVCCVLFTALDMVRGNYDAAARHMVHGLEIIAREQSIEMTSGHRCLPGWSTTATEGVMSAVAASFYRLGIAAFFYGRPDALLRGRVRSDSSRYTMYNDTYFNGVNEARQSMTNLAGDTLKLAAEASESTDVGIVSDEHFRRRGELREGLVSWQASFAATLATMGSAGSNRRLRLAQLVLETQRISLEVLLGTCFDAAESAYDAYFDEFRSILVLCEEYIEVSTSLQSSKPQCNAISFTFDMEILPQLWLVGKKCRHREYRRWCAALLSNHSCKEGMWDPRLIHALTSRVMEIEESSLPPEGGNLLPSESDRLWAVTLQERFSNASAATFAYKPAALGGRGVCWDEIIRFK